jgi:hypothetical protein
LANKAPDDTTEVKSVNPSQLSKEPSTSAMASQSNGAPSSFSNDQQSPPQQVGHSALKTDGTSNHRALPSAGSSTSDLAHTSVVYHSPLTSGVKQNRDIASMKTTSTRPSAPTQGDDKAGEGSLIRPATKPPVVKSDSNPGVRRVTKLPPKPSEPGSFSTNRVSQYCQGPVSYH